MLKFRYAQIIFFNLNPVGYAYEIKRASSHLKSGHTGRTIHVVASHTWNSGPARAYSTKLRQRPIFL